MDIGADPVVITGMGCVTPFGVGVGNLWEGLVAGLSGIRRNNRFDTTDFVTGVAGLVPDKTQSAHGFDATDHMEVKDIKKADLFIQYGMAAAAEALKQANWRPSAREDREATATVIGSGVGGSPAFVRTVDAIREKGPRRLSPFTVPSFLANLAAGWISIKYGFTGPIGTPVTACAASSQAIGDGLRLILSGEAEVAVVGGAEACVDPVSIGGFGASRALATGHDENPRGASRPFDVTHNGFVLAEGAAVLVIERLSHARKRGAKPLARLLGYGTSADAYHLTAGPPDGAGAKLAMQKALAMAKLEPARISYINAHATATPVGDAAEAFAISQLFSGSGKKLSVSSTKSATGHMLGAAGAVEAIIACQSVIHDIVAPTLNLVSPVENIDVFDLPREQGASRPVDFALSNSFGFGGVNASVIVGKIARS